MIRLLRSNITRLGKNGLFRVGVLVSAGMGAFCPIITGWMVNRQKELAMSFSRHQSASVMPLL